MTYTEIESMVRDAAVAAAEEMFGVDLGDVGEDLRSFSEVALAVLDAQARGSLERAS